MKEHEKLLNEAVRIFRMTDTKERPMIMGRVMNPAEYKEMCGFTYSLGGTMHEIQSRRGVPLTEEELCKMCTSAAKWAIEEFTTRKPALNRQI